MELIKKERKTYFNTKVIFSILLILGLLFIYSQSCFSVDPNAINKTEQLKYIKECFLKELITSTIIVIISSIILSSLSILALRKKSKKTRIIILVIINIILYLFFTIYLVFNYIDYKEKEEIINFRNGQIYNPNDPFTSYDKPIIYIYPTEESNVSVKLLEKEKITCSYPKYIDGWNVLAKTDSTLIDLDTNRILYSLYYEAKSDSNFKIEDTGFVIKGEDTISFLEEKLAILGLTQREAEEFIIYWLPKLEANKYNYIRFATLEEINKEMPLEISPTPDNIIRVLMTFKGLDNPIEVTEQILSTPDRDGFTVVEWGGSEIK